MRRLLVLGLLLLGAGCEVQAHAGGAGRSQGRRWTAALGAYDGGPATDAGFQQDAAPADSGVHDDAAVDAGPDAGTPAFASDYMVTFDGVDEYLSVDAASLYPASGMDKYTVAMWVALPGGWGGRMFLVSPGYQALDARGSNIVRIRNPGSNYTLHASPDTGWQLLVLTVDTTANNAEIHAAINGETSVTKATGTNLDWTEPDHSRDFGFATRFSISPPSEFGQINLRQAGLWEGVLVGTSVMNELIAAARTPSDWSAISTPPDHLWEMGDTAGDDSTTIQDVLGSADLTGTNLEAGDVTTVP